MHEKPHPSHEQAGANFAKYHHGDTGDNFVNSAANYAANFEQFVAPLTPNNTIVVALACTSGGLLLIILAMLFFVKHPSRR